MWISKYKTLNNDSTLKNTIPLITATSGKNM